MSGVSYRLAVLNWIKIMSEDVTFHLFNQVIYLGIRKPQDVSQLPPHGRRRAKHPCAV
jgi:hypothetical protein